MDFSEIRKEAKRQGFREEATKKGVRFVPPDPTKPAVQWHNTPSDQNAVKIFLGHMKRSGLSWPRAKKKGKKQ